MCPTVPAICTRGGSVRSLGASSRLMPDNKRDRPSWVRYSSVGIEFAAVVAGFAAVGYWIDLKFESAPWGVVIGAVLGLVGGTYNLIRESLAAFRPPRPPDRRDEEQ